MKEKIRPIYFELQGCLSQAPKGENWFFANAVWEHYNAVIDELSNVSGDDYSNYKVNPKNYSGGPSVDVLDYRNKLGGLIARLHGKFFRDEPAPFSGMPNTIITQNQQQNQSLQVQILLEIQSKIDEKIPQFPENSKERGFLDKLKGSLSSVKNVTELILLLLKTGKDAGLSIDQILGILK